MEKRSWTNEITSPEVFCLNMENHINVTDIRRSGGDSKGTSPEYKYSVTVTVTPSRPVIPAFETSGPLSS